MVGVNTTWGTKFKKSWALRHLRTTDLEGLKGWWGLKYDRCVFYCGGI